MYLEKINSPEDVKKLSIDEMKELSSEIRKALLNRLSEKGGHVGPNLGVVELDFHTVKQGIFVGGSRRDLIKRINHLDDIIQLSLRDHQA